MTGQYHWRLGTGANLWSRLDAEHKTYAEVLEDNGYFTGHWRKAWGPGKLDNRDRHPDSEIIRSDVADYYREVRRFDSDVGKALERLERLGLLGSTIVVMTGDHGMPFPRAKGNLYDSGVRVPLAVRWPAGIHPGRVVKDFVSTTDLAPTFLELAGLEPLDVMTGDSLLPVFNSKKSGRIEEWRDRVFTGKERHVPAQEAPDSGGTPMRAIRTYGYLLIRNYRPDRWPAGTPNYREAFIPGTWFGDIDNGPTKTYMVGNKDKDEDHRRKFELAFGKRQAVELYDLRKDPGQLDNVADLPEYAAKIEELTERLNREFRATDDPRVVDLGDETFDPPPYFGGTPKHPDWEKKN